MARKTYTEAEKEAYKRGLAAAKKKQSPARKGGTTKSRTRARRTGTSAKKTGKGPKRSKCSAVDSYVIRATGERVERPRISAYRIDKQFGYQKMVAFLSKNDGMPKNEANGARFRNMVVTLTSKAGKSVVNGIWDDKYQKLKIVDLGLVANPFAPNGGYFGPGGTRLKAKATKGK